MRITKITYSCTSKSSVQASFEILGVVVTVMPNNGLLLKDPRPEFHVAYWARQGGGPKPLSLVITVTVGLAATGAAGMALAPLLQKLSPTVLAVVPLLQALLREQSKYRS
jgi:hypothetical protein